MRGEWRWGWGWGWRVPGGVGGKAFRWDLEKSCFKACEHRSFGVSRALRFMAEIAGDVGERQK